MKNRLLLLGVVAAATGVGVHFYTLFTEVQRLNRSAELEILISSSFALLQLVFILSFTLFGFGLLIIRRRLGQTCSIIGLLGVLLGYGYWYWYSTQFLSRYAKDPFLAQHPHFIPSHSFGLIGGNWWDLTILIATVIPAVVVVVSASTRLTTKERRRSR